MKRSAAEPYRDIDFSRAARGPVIRPEPGKTKISIRLDNRILDHFRGMVEAAGGGNYQTLINDALLAHIVRGTALEAARKAVREQQRPLVEAIRRAVREEVSAARRRRRVAAG